MMNGPDTPPPPLKLGVALATRGRPSAMCGVIASAWRLQSAQNHLAFTVAADEDDTPTLAMLDMMRADPEGIPVIPAIAPRSPYLGGAQNRAVAAQHGADIVTLLSDRTFPITPGWDAGIVDAAMRFPNRILWWSNPHDPDTVVPVIPHTVLDAMDWKYSPETYSFWYDDTHWMEIDRMAFCAPSLKIRVMYSGVRQRTTRGREFEFWTKLFIALRPKRVELAKRLAATLNPDGWREPHAAMLDDFRKRDEYLLSQSARFEEVFGDHRPPGPEYMMARERAEEMMREMAS